MGVGKDNHMLVHHNMYTQLFTLTQHQIYVANQGGSRVSGCAAVLLAGGRCGWGAPHQQDRGSRIPHPLPLVIQHQVVRREYRLQDGASDHQLAVSTHLLRKEATHIFFHLYHSICNFGMRTFCNVNK